MKGSISKDTKSRALHRLKIMEGQIRGLEKMVREEEYCIDILHQSIAIQNSLKSLNAFILENHLVTHLSKQLKKNPNSAVKEMIKLYKVV